jgi:hypothetical protein
MFKKFKIEKMCRAAGATRRKGMRGRFRSFGLTQTDAREHFDRSKCIVPFEMP